MLARPGIFPGCVERAVPQQVRGHTLIRVRAAQVGHLDLDVVDGSFPGTAALPMVPGTEGSGEVVESDAFAAGARVRIRGGGVGLHIDGAWSELALVPDTALFPVPDAVPAWLATCFFSPACTAWAAVHDVARVHAGERVLVTGAAGAVGGLAVQLAAAAGARVTGLVGRPAKLPHVPSVAQPLLTAQAGDLAREFDVLIDSVGGRPFATALDKVRPGGRAAVLGYSAGTEFADDLRRFVVADVALLPVNLLRRGPALVDVADRLLHQLVIGELHLPVQRTDPAGLADAAAGLRTGTTVGKLALVWD